ncbi:AraC family transcriptional regulator [uncultured Sanguibacteroides sp.]|uniref:helix-turn-helix domain-containing protein n=1 Tax=uncultured Sanguibacteroides sp. TaxID=1635151 RepID=UPI0025F625A5|nr:AraC family transcriptional regulator [uncultured Sanguibacteroides sp.]
MNENGPYGELLQKFIFTTDMIPTPDGKSVQGLPYADIQNPYIVGPEINGSILKMYHYPCRLKACIFVVSLKGEADISINLERYKIQANHFACIAPGSIIQCHSCSEDLRLCFIAFSSTVTENDKIQKSALEIFPLMKERPVLSVRPEVSQLFCDYFKVLTQSHLIFPEDSSIEIIIYILLPIFHAVKYLHQLHPTENKILSRSEEIYKEFLHLLKENYTKERGVVFYAESQNLSPQHLSTTIRQVCGQTVSSIIAEMVIIDAKAQLKSTRSKIKEIASSLNFPNLSYFGKYFKRHTGMSPQEYRDAQ